MIRDLYETIGGKETIWAAIASFYRRVLEDEQLRPFFEGTDMAHLQSGQSMFISMLVGGRVVYTGKDLGAAHATARLQGLKDHHFDAFLAHFRAAMDEVGVKGERADEVMTLLESKRAAVLSKADGARVP